MNIHRHRFIVLLCLAAIVAVSTSLYVFGVFGRSEHPTEQYTPVFAAAAGGDLTTVRTAVDKDSSLVKAKGWENETLLHVAVGQNQQDVAAYLMDKGADVNAVTTEGLTALHMAAQNGNRLLPFVARQADLASSFSEFARSVSRKRAPQK